MRSNVHNGLFIHAFVMFLPLEAVFYVTSNRAASTVHMGILTHYWLEVYLGWSRFPGGEF